MPANFIEIDSIARCACDDNTPPTVLRQKLDSGLATLQAVQNADKRNEVLTQEIGLTLLRMARVDEKIGNPSQLEADMKSAQARFSSLGWRDVSKQHLFDLIDEIDSPANRVPAK